MLGHRRRILFWEVHFFSPNFCGFISTGFVNRCGQTPRRGDRLFGLATAAKKECTKKCVEQKTFAAKHGIRLANHLQDWQISVEFEGGYLLTVLIPLSALVAEEIFEDMLP